jgi:hypothetical protein
MSLDEHAPCDGDQASFAYDSTQLPIAEASSQIVAEMRAVQSRGQFDHVVTVQVGRHRRPVADDNCG